MSEARDKLLETIYFLTRLRETRSDRAAFKHNLSALLSAARSVTYVMVLEYKHIPGFQKWYAQKQAALRADPVAKLMFDKRRVTVHFAVMRPGVEVSVRLSETLTVSESVSVVVVHSDGGTTTAESKRGSAVPRSASRGPRSETVEWRWFFDEMASRDIVSLAQDYVSQLDGLVRECGERFGELDAPP